MLQYGAVGVQSDIWTAYTRADCKKNLDGLAFNISRAIRYAEMDLPVRLVTLTEGAIGGWASWAGGNEQHLKAYRDWAPDIEGPETEFLGKLCKDGNFYRMGQMQARDPELMKDRIFNIGFIIDPNGKVILKHHKTAMANLVEQMTEPIHIWDRYLELYGDDPVKLCEALYPVAKTEIGNLGIIICAEGSFPEAARGLALNGAEVIWRPNFVEPHLSNGMFEVMNRSHAVFNTAYVISTCASDVYGYRTSGGGGASEVSRDHRVSWGQSRMYDYRGNLISEVLGTGQSFVSGIFDIDGLRDFRVRSPWISFAKEIRVEEYKVIYDALAAKGGMYQKNLCMEDAPPTEAEFKEIAKHHINRAVDLGIYTPPPGWEPHAISEGVRSRIRKAANYGKKK